MADQSLFNAARRWADVPKLDPETERAAAEATRPEHFNSFSRKI